MSINYKQHLLFSVIILLTVVLLNILPWIFSGIPLTNQLSSDAEYHIVYWYEYSNDYENNFLHDKLFRSDIRPAGDWFVDKIIAKIGNFLDINLLNLSIIVSAIALLLFLSGVYVLSNFVFDDPFWAFIITLGSIIPTFALGGTTWGFLTLGYLPREMALGFILWLLFLFLYNKKYHIVSSPLIIFFVIGLLANWYPVIFFHFAMVLILADIIQKRKISTEHLLSGILFFGGASFAVFDILSKANLTVAPDLNILHMRLRYMMIFSFNYGVFHYLRRIILYLVLISCLIFVYRKLLKDKLKESVSFWISIFVSSAVIMTSGILLEQYTVYAKLLLSRTSIYFIFSSMLIMTIVFSNAYDYFFQNKKLKKLLVGGLLLVIFIGQSSIPTIYRSLKDTAQNASKYKSFINAVQFLSSHTTPKDLVLANAKNANKIRAYGKRAVYSSWKEGGISLLDGQRGKQWYQRYSQNNEILQTGDLNKILEFSKTKGISVIFIETGKIDQDSYQTKKLKYFQIENFDIILL